MSKFKALLHIPSVVSTDWVISEVEGDDIVTYANNLRAFMKELFPEVSYSVRTITTIVTDVVIDDIILN